MKNITVYIILICATLNISCSKKNESHPEYQSLPWNINSEVFVENLIDSLTVIPLEAIDIDSYLKSYISIKVDDANIYINDRISRKIISFDHSGKFNTRYGRLGKAVYSGEYLEAATFCTDANFIYFIDNFNKKLFKFNKNNGKYVSNYKLPNSYYDVEVLDNGNFIFLWYPRYSESEGSRRYKLTITDPELNILQQLYEATEDDGYDGKFAFLSKYDDKISYHAYYQDSIQLLNTKDGSKQATYYMEIDNKLPQNLKINKDPYSNNEDLLNYTFITGSYGSPVITDNYIFGSLYNGTKSHSHFFIYDLKNKEYILPSDDFPRQFNGQSFCCYNGNIYCCVSKEVIDELAASKLKVSFAKPSNDQCDFYIVKFTININS